MPIKKSPVKKDVIETVYTTTIKYLCPRRGWVEEEVRVKKYSSSRISSENLIEVESLNSELEEGD